MDFITDLLWDFIASALGIGPETDRGVVRVFSTGSTVLTGATAWLLLTAADPIMEPKWGVAVLAASIVCGGGGLLVSLAYVRRHEHDRVFGVVCSAINLAALAIPTAWILVR